MPVDNTVYDRMADSWWDEDGFLHALAALNPARFDYMRRVLMEKLRLAPGVLQVLDIGCGGGLLTEEFARLGCAVVGVDPSVESLAVARRHAAGQGLAIRYQCATGEALPFVDESFDIVYCCDVLEHVNDWRQVIAETARVLRPGGAYLYDTINRTPQSRLIVIKLLQEWRWTALMPPRLHDWHMFIRPAELRRELEHHSLVPGGLTGLKPRANPLRLVRALRRRKRGLLSYAAAVREMDLGESPDTSISYIGYARKPDPTAGMPRDKGVAERAPPNPRMQPTGRTGAALIAGGALRERR
jgi:2-polyprenyl-6-hydroxyphenyl methylase / 3-demethylubiquinone-9 3-methyltransferase